MQNFAIYRFIISALMLAITTVLHAQSIQPVNYPELGVSFEVPKGWLGQAVENGYLMGSNAFPGFMLITSHDLTNLPAIKKELSDTFKIGPNSTLAPIGTLETVSDHVVGNTFSGTISGEPAKAVILGCLNPNGLGITIISASNESVFSNQNIEAALKLVQSLTFTKPAQDTPNVQNRKPANEWEKKFNDCRLTYMESYTSNGTGSYGKKVKIDLCGDGYFKHSSYNSMSVSGGNYNGGYGNTNKGAGTWEILKNEDEVILRLNFYDGERYDYAVTIDKDDKTFLNGNRYFRTYEDAGKYGPKCN
ncbi:MAG: hypothetical protein AAGD88_04020 [Bacteroidota bacterium]